jgi:hypothetical protein
MTSQEYTEVAQELDQLLRLFPIADDPRIVRLMCEARDTAKVRARDLATERRSMRLTYGH